MQNFGMSMLWFWICYVLVTLVGILHTIFNIYVLHMKPMDAHGMVSFVLMITDKVYNKTVRKEILKKF